MSDSREFFSRELATYIDEYSWRYETSGPRPIEAENRRFRLAHLGSTGLRRQLILLAHDENNHKIFGLRGSLLRINPKRAEATLEFREFGDNPSRPHRVDEGPSTSLAAELIRLFLEADINDNPGLYVPRIQNAIELRAADITNIPPLQSETN